MARLYYAVVQRIRGKQAQLDLNPRDRVHGMGLADRVGADLAQADAADLALLDQLGQCSDGGLDGNLRINPCKLEDVNSLDTT